MATAANTPPLALVAPRPKLTAHVDVLMTEAMKEQLDALLARRVAMTGHNLALADLGREAFLLLLALEAKKSEAAA